MSLSNLVKKIAIYFAIKSLFLLTNSNCFYFYMYIYVSFSGIDFLVDKLYGWVLKLPKYINLTRNFLFSFSNLYISFINFFLFYFLNIFLAIIIINYIIFFNINSYWFYECDARELNGSILLFLLLYFLAKDVNTHECSNLQIP